jgi:cytochrome b6-f complex iron-sulfur subunit
MGCELHWNPDTDRYECPCHEGRFSAEGRVLSGPPLQPMTFFPARVEDESVVVTLEPKASG